MTTTPRPIPPSPEPSALQSAIPSHEILLCFDNLALATNGATAAASSEADGSNLSAAAGLSESLDTAWRSEDLGYFQAGSSDPSIYYTIALAEPAAVNWLGLHKHNVRVPFRVSFYTADPDSKAAAVYVSEWIDPIVRASLSDYGWFDLDWNLAPSDKRLNDLAARFALESFIHSDATYYGIRFVRVEFNNNAATNAGETFLQVGLFYVCEVYRPSINITLGWALAGVPYSTTVRTPSGSKRGRFRKPGRRLSFALEYIQRSEAFDRLFGEWILEGAELRRAFVWAEPHQRRYFYTSAILGTLESVPEFAMAQLESPAARGFVVQETE